MSYYLRDIGNGRFELCRTTVASLGTLTDRAIAERFVEFLNLSDISDEVFAEMDAELIGAPLPISDGVAELVVIQADPAARAAEVDAASDVATKLGTAWSEAEDAEMMRLHDLGISRRKIADTLGRTLPAVTFRIKNKARDRREAVETQQAVTLTESQSALDAHVEALGHDDFTPGDDLTLFEGMTSGVPIEILADQLGCDTKTVSARWFALLPEAVVTAKGALTVQGSTDLLHVLRVRAARDEDA